MCRNSKFSNTRLYPEKYGSTILAHTAYGLANNVSITYFLKFENATEVPTWGDSCGYSGTAYYPYFALQANTPGWGAAACNPHAGMINLAFLDGHAESVKPGRWGNLMDKINAGTDNYTSKKVPYYDIPSASEKNAF